MNQYMIYFIQKMRENGYHFASCVNDKEKEHVEVALCRAQIDKKDYLWAAEFDEFGDQKMGFSTVFIKEAEWGPKVDDMFNYLYKIDHENKDATVERIPELSPLPTPLFYTGVTDNELRYMLEEYQMLKTKEEREAYYMHVNARTKDEDKKEWKRLGIL